MNSLCGLSKVEATNVRQLLNKTTVNGFMEIVSEQKKNLQAIDKYSLEEIIEESSLAREKKERIVTKPQIEKRSLKRKLNIANVRVQKDRRKHNTVKQSNLGGRHCSVDLSAAPGSNPKKTSLLFFFQFKI